MKQALRGLLQTLGGMKTAVLGTVLAISAAVLALSSWMYVDKQMINADIAALRSGKDLAVDAAEAPPALLEARASFLLKRSHFDDAQQYLDQAALRAEPDGYARMLYNMANSRMRVAIRSIEQGNFDKAIPLVQLAKAEYRSALRIDPEDWDAKHNLDVAMRLVRDLPQAVPEDKDDPLETPEKLWSDLPGTPQGLP
ncbi:hypothetical protein [Hyphomicrobium sp. D-2]|uniref:hypothetical protein n=1 Tax=Hyphomicrobium sp. D-2 TaxID=3041621 RepID=UPI0024541EC5|nr:hypothetical protein [Hyphomicrobium sp. D-2]MDH4981967.1 hypothetical protein [Hyphomicrobium sp. D-2]